MMLNSQPPTLHGTPVLVSLQLPIATHTPGEDARRMVRHGLADVLAWLGEPVGPAPGEATTHAVAAMDPATGHRVLFVSQAYMHQLRTRCAL